MTAGSGIVHSERSPSAERAIGPELSGIQTWIALPDGCEEMAPAFEHVDKADLPVIEDNGAKARVVMGSLWGRQAPTTTRSEEHTSELQSLMRISYAVFCLKKKKNNNAIFIMKV